LLTALFFWKNKKQKKKRVSCAWKTKLSFSNHCK
jgi:hypothetical protein